MSSTAVGENVRHDVLQGEFLDSLASSNHADRVPDLAVHRQIALDYRRLGKRAFDVAASALALLAFGPLILLLALCVYASDRANPFFSHTRVGLDGRRFGCLKLRSMVVGAEAKLAELLRADPAAAAEWAETQKLEDDPRVTRFGRFLRKTSLDELPQLLNVLKGDMSLVGPRPVTPDELLRYGSYAGAYMRLRPGVTGMWQTMGRNDISYDERVQLDVAYEREVGFRLDLRIIFLTAFAILRATGK